MNIYCAEKAPHNDLINARENGLTSSLYEAKRSTVRQAYRRLSGWLKTRHERKINRDAFSHLLKLDDGLLDDIGVTRDSVRWAASLPLSVDASCALQETARGRNAGLRDLESKYPHI